MLYLKRSPAASGDAPTGANPIMTEPTEPILLSATQDRVRLLTLNRPRRRNAFNNALYLELAEALTEASADASLGAILIRGAGPVFCAGQDINEMATPEEGATLGFVKLLEALMACELPIVTAVSGYAVGIGATMLLHTDMNYVAVGTRLRFPFVALGVVPEAASSAILPALMGYQRAAEILYTSRWVEAEESVTLGLTVATLPAEGLHAHALAAAAQVARQAPQALRATKRLIRASRDAQVRAALEREYDTFTDHLGSPENHEAIQAFFEKREPDFFKD